MFQDYIEVKQNVRITARERGKIVARREGHNIWLNLGRTYLARVLSYSSFSPDTPSENARIKYMGVGIGSTAQTSLGIANAAPMVPSYSGTNTQTDDDPLVTTLERPVRISGSQSNYPGLAGDVWVGQVQAPPDFSVDRQVTYTRVFSEDEVSYNTYSSVPLSEVGLLTSNADIANYQNTLIAYETFDTLSKTPVIAVEIVWTLQF